MIASVRILLAFVLVISHAGTASGWQALGHYQIAADAGANSGIANLPDSWPSHGDALSLWGVTEWFAWSHGVQRTGRTTGVPNIPIYLPDAQQPGFLMYEHYRKAFRGANPDAYGTALGFLVHNAQDRVVHWRYFRGGSKAAWREEHEYKEFWADCWIYRIRMNGRFDRGAPLTLPPTLGNEGHPGLVRAAQQTSRASNISVDRGLTTLIAPESTGEIAQRFRDGSAALRAYLSNDFRGEKCDHYSAVYAANYDWTMDELEEYYSRAVSETRRILNAFPR